MLVFCAVVIFYTVFSSFVQCSGIITKSMIRMPNGSFHGFSRPMTPVGHQLPKPEMLISRPSEKEPQAVNPIKSEEVQNTSIESSGYDKNTTFETPIAEHFVQLNSPTVFSNTTPSLNEKHDPRILERKDTTKFPEDGLETLKEAAIKLNTTISPKELSSKYWMQYNNFSHDFFNKWSNKGKSNDESKTDKRYPDNSILEMIQRIFGCFWRSELFTCVQDGFVDTSLENLSFFQLMSPRFPRFQLDNDAEEDFASRNDGFEYNIVEEDEGRKRLSKRLQQLIPFLLAIKMTMLPALAIMALVSGKAFLMSLLSLGVALITTFSSAIPFRADKRHEIAPQSTAHSSHPTDQLPGKYYYVM